jgi:hypothetical protein
MDSKQDKEMSTTTGLSMADTKVGEADAVEHADINSDTKIENARLSQIVRYYNETRYKYRIMDDRQMTLAQLLFEVNMNPLLFWKLKDSFVTWYSPAHDDDIIRIGSSTHHVGICPDGASGVKKCVAKIITECNLNCKPSAIVNIGNSYVVQLFGDTEMILSQYKTVCQIVRSYSELPFMHIFERGSFRLLVTNLQCESATYIINLLSCDEQVSGSYKIIALYDEINEATKKYFVNKVKDTSMMLVGIKDWLIAYSCIELIM